MQQRLILLNGPAACGKNVAVDHIKKYINVVDRRCKDKLYALTQEIFSVNPTRFWELYNDRSLKELPVEDFKIPTENYLIFRRKFDLKPRDTDLEGDTNLSVREAMIYISEEIIKPNLGLEYFGKARVDSMSNKEIAIDDSTGFVEELLPAINKLGQENLLLIRIKGRGSFEGDSRDFIPDGIITNTVDVYNKKTEGEYLEEVLSIVEDFIGGDNGNT